MFWIFGGATGKRVTREEFKERVIPHLRDRGFSEDDIRYVRAVLDAHLNESGSEQGISEKEIDALVKNLHENAPSHFSPENLSKTEEELRKAL